MRCNLCQRTAESDLRGSPEARRPARLRATCAHADQRSGRRIGPPAPQAADASAGTTVIGSVVSRTLRPARTGMIMARSTDVPWCVHALLGLLFAALSWRASAVAAGETRPSAVDPLETVVVTGTRLPVPDDELKRQVTTALHDDPFFYDEHVTVTVQDGVVHLEGFVLDVRDIRDVLRIIRKKFPGKRVVNQLEVSRDESDDG